MCYEVHITENSSHISGLANTFVEQLQGLWINFHLMVIIFILVPNLVIQSVVAN